MFDAHCRRCGTAVLLTTRRIISLHHTSQGIVVYFRCWCGTPGVLVTGSGAGRPSERDPATSGSSEVPAGRSHSGGRAAG